MRKVLTTLATLITITALSTAVAFAATSSSGLSNEYSKYYHNEMFKKSIVVGGIDISAWQNVISEKTFRSMKFNGVDFVILRVGYTGSVSKKPTLDDCFEKNYINAKKAGMEIGVYHYSIATTTSKSTEEAKFVLKHIKDKKITYPIFIDVEDPDFQGSKSKATLAKVSNNFCKVIEAANPDYRAGVYASLSWFTSKIGTINSKYDKWVAQYYFECQYTKPYIMWQYSSSGKLKCFRKRLDVNFRYLDDSACTSGYSLSKAEVSLSTSKYVYSGSQKKPTVKVKLGNKTLTKGTDYTVAYYKNVRAGTAYVMVSGKGKYTDCKIAKFKIAKYPLSNYEIKPISSRKYTGKAIQPALTVQKKEGSKVLTEGTNYSVKYENNLNVGTATVTVTGKGNYGDSLTATFKITKLTPTITGKSKFTKNDSTTFSLNAKTNGDGELKYSSSNNDVASVSKNGKVTTEGFGTATIKISSPKTSNCKSTSKEVTINVTGQVKNLKATDKTPKSATLTWDKLGLAQKYSVYKYNEAKDGFTLYNTTTDNQLVLKNLTLNKEYRFKVKAKDALGNAGVMSEEISFTPSLPNVKKLAVESKTSKRITLSWQRVKIATGYTVLKYNSSKKIYQVYEKIAGSNNTTCTITDLKPNTKYSFKVRCVYKDVKGPLTKISVNTKLAQVKIISVTASTSKIKVKWEKDNLIDHQIRYSKSKSFSTYSTVTVNTTNNYASIAKGKQKALYIKVRALKKTDKGTYYGAWSKTVKVDL